MSQYYAIVSIAAVAVGGGVSLFDWSLSYARPDARLMLHEYNKSSSKI